MVIIDDRPSSQYTGGLTAQVGWLGRIYESRQLPSGAVLYEPDKLSQ